MKTIKIVTIALATLMLIGSLISFANIQTASAGNFTVKATHVNLCNIMPGHPSYVPNWANLLQGLGINTLRIEDGGEGRLGYNINLDANWAQNLMKVLDTINPDRTGTTGYKIYWQRLGDPYLANFGINDYHRTPYDGANDGSGGSGLMSIYTVRSMIDKLAGNNALGHNFITDPRIIAWSVGNENLVGTSNGYGGVNTNNVYSWLIQIMDYIRSKGGRVIADAPYVDDWNSNLALTAPLFNGHADYMEIHHYGVYELSRNYYYGNNQFNWAGWKSYMQGYLSSQVNAANNVGFDSNHVFLGEFGIFPAYNPDWNTGIYWTQQTQADYYTNYFQVLDAVSSIKWTSPFCAFMSGAYYYGFIAAPSGTTYPAYNVIAANYAGSTYTYTPTTYTPTYTPTPTPPQTGSATFGATSIGGLSTTFYSGIPRAAQYTPSSSGTVTDIMLYITSNGAGGHAQVAIYANNGGKPGALLAKSSSDTITSSGWHDFAGFNVAITAGTAYWLAFEADNANLVFHYNNGGANYYQGTGGPWGSYSYGTFPNPYNTLYYGSYSPSIYAIYTSSGYTPTPTPPQTGSATFGATSIGGLSTTFYSGIPRAAQYTPSSSGTVTDIMLYITSNGAGGHAQVAIYANNGGKPGALLAKSSSDTITSSGWHDFAGFNVAITAGTAYWLAFEADNANLVFHYNNGGANYYQGTGGPWGSYSYGTFPNPYNTLYYGSYSPSIYAIYTQY